MVFVLIIHAFFQYIYETVFLHHLLTVVAYPLRHVLFPKIILPNYYINEFLLVYDVILQKESK